MMNDALQQGITAFRAGKRDEARKFLIAAVKQEPENEQAWGWLYKVANNDKERMACLQQILRINPQNDRVKQLLDGLNGSVSPLSSKETNTNDQPVTPPPGTVRQVFTAKTDKKIQTNEKATIKWQYIAFFATLVLFFPVSSASVNLFHTWRYAGLLPAAMLIYIGLSSVTNRVSIMRIRGQNDYARDQQAVLFGMLSLLIGVGEIIYACIPLLTGLFLSFINPLSTTSEQNGFTTAFILAKNVSDASNDYRMMQITAVLGLGVGITGCIWVGRYLIQKRQPPRYAISLALMTVVSIVGLSMIEGNQGALVRDCVRLQTLYDSQQYTITEGNVHVQHAQSIWGHQAGDMIVVGNGSNKIEINYFSVTCGYKTTIAYGGVLTENTYAKIYTADNGAILRIDLRNK